MLGLLSLLPLLSAHPWLPQPITAATPGPAVSLPVVLPTLACPHLIPNNPPAAGQPSPSGETHTAAPCARPLGPPACPFPCSGQSAFVLLNSCFRPSCFSDPHPTTSLSLSVASCSLIIEEPGPQPDSPVTVLPTSLPSPAPPSSYCKVRGSFLPLRGISGGRVTCRDHPIHLGLNPGSAPGPPYLASLSSVSFSAECGCESQDLPYRVVERIKWGDVREAFAAVPGT